MSRKSYFSRPAAQRTFKYVSSGSAEKWLLQAIMGRMNGLT
jgi:hypothetical protein